MALTEKEIRGIAVATADEVIARQRELELDSLMLHSTVYIHGSPGIVVNEAVAKSSPCRCFEYEPGKKLCFSKGIVGALSDEQEEIYCPSVEELKSPGLEKRLKSWMGAVTICKAEIKTIPEGEKLEPWLSCMGRELAAQNSPMLTKEILKLETRLPLELVEINAELREDIRLNGIQEPIEIRVREDGSQIVWDGLNRLAIAVELNLETVPVIFRKM
ncbi:hypothetical protein ES703_93176 [subsurface metagenome]